MLDPILDMSVRTLISWTALELVLTWIAWLLSFPVVGTYEIIKDRFAPEADDTSSDKKPIHRGPLTDLLGDPHIATTIGLLIAGHISFVVLDNNELGALNSLLLIALIAIAVTLGYKTVAYSVRELRHSLVAK